MEQQSLEILIRDARLEDTQPIFQIQLKALKSLNAKDYTAEQIKALINHKQDYHSRGQGWGDRVLVAEVDSTVVGFAALARNRVNALFVHPQYVRRRIGSRLMDALEESVKSRNFRKMVVLSSLTAHPFYSACGYRTLNQTTLLTADWVRVPCINMEKKLVPAKAEMSPLNDWDCALVGFMRSMLG